MPRGEGAPRSVEAGIPVLPGTDSLVPGVVAGFALHDELEALVAAGMSDGRVFETYWTTVRGVEVMDNSYALLDLTVYGRQENWEDSPPGWPQEDIMDTLRTNGRPTAQWARLNGGRSDDLGNTGRRNIKSRPSKRPARAGSDVSR
jgi:Bacterial protein of unknown function (DUF899)